MYDAIVIGARCAGSPTAMLLTRKGYRVLLVDKSTFPSDTMSTHFIQLPGILQLKRWGLLEKVVTSNCPSFVKWTFDVGPFALTGSPPPAAEVAEVYCPRRTVLDKFLVDAAAEAGAELREAFSVEEVMMDGERVTGIRGRAKGGRTVTEEARIVIGADGLHSIVARTVRAPQYNTKPPLTCTYYTYWSDVRMDGVEIYPREGRMIIAFPTNDDLTCTFLQWPIREFHQVRADIEGNYVKSFEFAPKLAERVRNGRREERFVGTVDVPNFFRKPYGPGWALVGDAGYHKDPNLAQGITDAFRDAELLTEAIDAGLSRRRPLEEALADYERERNGGTMPMYDFNCQMAALEAPPPQMMQLFAALRRNQAETNHFFGAITGTVPIPEFFSPENIQRIVATA